MRRRSSRFSPHLVAYEHLEQQTVGREVLLTQVQADLRDTVTHGGARYTLFVGPRGAGKSHLAALLSGRLRRDEVISANAFLSTLGEEEHVSSLLDLLSRLLRALPEVEGFPSPTAQALSLRKTPGREGEERAVRMIADRLQDRALLAIIENLDVVFAAIKPAGQARLRSILQSQGRWTVLATSQTAGAAFTNRDRPFFKTFTEHRLRPFDALECRQVLYRLAVLHEETELAEYLQTSEGLARVKAIFHLIGGNPRGLALIFPYLDRESLDELVGAFYDLAEELTPYFQEQVTRRPPSQRPILEALAENWRPMSVQELAEATFSTHQSTSGQLRYLRRDGLVRSLAVGRERFYELSDPLTRIARAMKRPDDAVATFARFLRYWHAHEELLLRRDREKNHEYRGFWERALGIRGDEGSSYSSAMEKKFYQLMNSEQHDNALELAERFHEKSPGIISYSAKLLAHSLKNTGLSGQIAHAFVDGFPAEGIFHILFMYYTIPIYFDIDVLARARQTLQKNVDFSLKEDDDLFYDLSRLIDFLLSTPPAQHQFNKPTLYYENLFFFILLITNLSSNKNSFKRFILAFKERFIKSHPNISPMTQVFVELPQNLPAYAALSPQERERIRTTLRVNAMNDILAQLPPEPEP